MIRTHSQEHSEALTERWRTQLRAMLKSRSAGGKVRQY